MSFVTTKYFPLWNLSSEVVRSTSDDGFKCRLNEFDLTLYSKSKHG